MASLPAMPPPVDAEAAALRVEALCRLGDDRADAGWDAFLVRWPTSAQQPRIAAACKEPRR